MRHNPSGGASWLTFLGRSKDSLWSLDLFRCESLFLRSHWVMVVVDQYSRRIIGFAVQADTLDGSGICRMFDHVISSAERLPANLSIDNARTHHGRSGATPSSDRHIEPKKVAMLNDYGWTDYCRGLYQLPMAA